MPLQNKLWNKKINFGSLAVVPAVSDRYWYQCGGDGCEICREQGGVHFFSVRGQALKPAQLFLKVCWFPAARCPEFTLQRGEMRAISPTARVPASTVGRSHRETVQGDTLKR